jgi:molecular chaperone DnaK
VIQSSGGLSKDEIENMVKDAEKYAAEDKVRKDRVEIVNQAESVINDIERNMAEYKDQLPTEEADKLRDSIANLRQTLANPDEATPEAIRESTGELQKSALKLFEIAYKSKMSENEQKSQDSSSSSSEKSSDSESSTSEGEATEAKK